MMNLDRTGLQLDGLAVARQIVGPLALDLDRGILRRGLLDQPGEAGQQFANRLSGGPQLAGSDDPALGIVGVPLLAPGDRKAIALAAVHHEGDRLGGFAEGDRQAAGGERVERAGVACGTGPLRQNYFFRRPANQHLARRKRRSRWVRSSVYSSESGELGARSLCTAGVRSNFSIRSASSNRSSTRKRTSGANFKLTRRAISPRRNFLFRSSAAITTSVSRPPSGIT